MTNSLNKIITSIVLFMAVFSVNAHASSVEDVEAKRAAAAEVVQFVVPDLLKAMAKQAPSEGTEITVNGQSIVFEKDDVGMIQTMFVVDFRDNLVQKLTLDELENFVEIQTTANKEERAGRMHVSFGYQSEFNVRVRDAMTSAMKSSQERWLRLR